MYVGIYFFICISSWRLSLTYTDGWIVVNWRSQYQQTMSTLTNYFLRFYLILIAVAVFNASSSQIGLIKINFDFRSVVLARIIKDVCICDFIFFAENIEEKRSKVKFLLKQSEGKNFFLIKFSDKRKKESFFFFFFLKE